MKKQQIALASIFISTIAFSQTIYTGDGTLSANRTVTMDSKNLNFNGPAAGSNVFINGSNGNVGIGNTTPAEKLDVSGIVKSKNLLATNTATSATSFILRLPVQFCKRATICAKWQRYVLFWQ